MLFSDFLFFIFHYLPSQSYFRMASFEGFWLKLQHWSPQRSYSFSTKILSFWQHFIHLLFSALMQVDELMYFLSNQCFLCSIASPAFKVTAFDRFWLISRVISWDSCKMICIKILRRLRRFFTRLIFQNVDMDLVKEHFRIRPGDVSFRRAS